MNPLTKLFLFMLVMVVMAGCSSNSGSFEANVFTKSDLTVIDGEHDAELFIGMDKKDVEKHLGQPISESEKMGNEYNGLRIFYRNDKVSQFVIQPDENNSYRFKTSRGLELGQTMDDLIEKYGDEGIAEEIGDSKTVVYAFDLKEKTILSDMKQVKNPEETYVLSTLFDDKLAHILIGDYNAAVLMK